MNHANLCNVTFTFFHIFVPIDPRNHKVQHSFVIDLLNYTGVAKGCLTCFLVVSGKITDFKTYKTHEIRFDIQYIIQMIYHTSW